MLPDGLLAKGARSREGRDASARAGGSHPLGRNGMLFGDFFRGGFGVVTAGLLAGGKA